VGDVQCEHFANKGGFQMWTLALLVQKISVRIFQNLWCVCTDNGGRGWAGADILWTRRSIFSQSVITNSNQSSLTQSVISSSLIQHNHCWSTSYCNGQRL